MLSSVKDNIEKEITNKAAEKITSLILGYEDKLYEKECIIKELENKLTHTEALLGRDSTNTNLPTGQTPPDKKRYIPNSRRNSGKEKGGQKGHQKSTLKTLSLMNTTNAAINKASLLLSRMTEGEVCPSGGYIAKLMKRAVGKLDLFMSDLFQALIARTLAYWDDTVKVCIEEYIKLILLLVYPALFFPLAFMAADYPLIWFPFRSSAASDRISHRISSLPDYRTIRLT